MYEKDLSATLAKVALRRGGQGFTFDDLVRAASRRSEATIGQVADWLAGSRASGFVDDLGFDPGVGVAPLGPRRYRLAGRKAVEEEQPVSAG